MRVSTVLVFVARFYQYMFFDAPFRAFFWNESLLKPVVETLFNTTWQEYANSLTFNRWIQISIKANGIIFIIVALSSAIINDKNINILKYPIYIGSILLFFLSILSLKEGFYQFAQLFEYTIQIGVPLVLISITKKDVNYKRLVFILKILISVTFIAHGLYAIGFYPVPGNFIDMTINSLGITEDSAVIVLICAGIMDIAISIFIFMPKLSKYALIYAFIWGIMTALARITADFNLDFIFSSLHQLLYKVVYRLPHGLVPLAVLLYHYKGIKINKNIVSINNS